MDYMEFIKRIKEKLEIFLGQEYQISEKEIAKNNEVVENALVFVKTGTGIGKLQNILEEKRYEIKHGLYAKEDNIILDTYFKDWLEVYKKPSCKAGTIDCYQKTYDDYIKKAFGKKKLKELRPEQIQSHYNKLAKQYSQQTLKLVHILLNGIYKQAVKNQVVQRNPVSLVTLPKGKEPIKKRVPNAEEQAIFLKGLAGNECENLIRFAIGTGMRIGEIRALQWSNIDFNKKIIHIKGTF
ncbi:MAG: tyrosine-type recombinase/integrase [Lachnospiraceae bacterium]|jgi:integrase|nr:tyrosine-type recombinase/integrase [Lachnospiraceae bacterium]